jgi:hypothetical protein
MIALQEELDWQVYSLYGLTRESITLPIDQIPEIELGQRAFEIVMARPALCIDQVLHMPRLPALPRHVARYCPINDLRRLTMASLGISPRRLHTKEMASHRGKYRFMETSATYDHSSTSKPLNGAEMEGTKAVTCCLRNSLWIVDSG